MTNDDLGIAKKAKDDEFYTQFSDIQKEMNAYLEYNPDVFKGKIVLLPCDDPEWSNFTKYFAQNFEALGLKKLISTSYAPDSKPDAIPYQPTLFEMESPGFDPEKTQTKGKIFTLSKDTTGDHVINVDDLEWTYLEGGGDFRSEEITKLRDEADVIVTNPPFSLFREFLAWLVEANKKFIVLGNMNAITYKEVFPLIKQNELWLGASIHSGDREFRIPPTSVTRSPSRRTDEEGNVFLRVPGIRWFTNLDHGLRHEPLSLMTEQDNIKFSKHKEVKGIGYHKYQNYDAIEIPFTDAIPADYEGVMGVPISFLSKYSPDQFEIIAITNNKTVPTELLVPGQEKYDRPYIEGVRMYSRILIKHKQVSS
ncbi:MAG: hypothetical protein RI926_949 [Actinomycetota bacterium]